MRISSSFPSFNHYIPAEYLSIVKRPQADNLIIELLNQLCILDKSIFFQTLCHQMACTGESLAYFCQPGNSGTSAPFLLKQCFGNCSY